MTSETLEAAAARVEYDLSFKRSTTPRRFTMDGITGDDIDDAFGDGRQTAGSWDMPDWSYDGQSSDWILSFFKAAMSEAVHEVCEWFRVDGQLLLDPHGRLDMAAIAAAEAAAVTLYEKAIKAREEQ